MSRQVKSNKFRYDINGLRAWAVLAVVFYHFNVPGFGRGFLGVDIFFVISGYLMSSIVLEGFERNDFSVWKFYLARTRRIWPALIVLVLAVLLSGWFLLMPMEYEKLGKHARDTLLFSSNLTYLKESGYFDSSSHNKWLLHTWSLSIEWQFYLIYPLIMLALRRFFGSARVFIWVTFVLCAMSFLYAHYLNSTNYDRSFYLLPSRAWELLFGSLLYSLQGFSLSSERLRKMVESLGFVLILLGLFLLGHRGQWSAVYAAIPVLGAGMVLHAKAENGSLFTSWSLLQFIGSRSYSIYLWHWPIMVGLVYYELSQIPLWIAAGISASMLLGHWSYSYVELPTQKWLAPKSPWRSALILVSILVMVSVMAQQVRKTGFPSRVPPEIAQIEEDAVRLRHVKRRSCDETSCVYGGSDVQALVIGDSHASALFSAVGNALPESEQGVYLRSAGGCGIIFGSEPTGKVPQSDIDKCAALLSDLEAQIDNLHPGKPIFVINRTALYVEGESDTIYSTGSRRPWLKFSEQVDNPTPEFRQQYRDAYIATACHLAKKHPLYLMRPVPEFPAPVPQIMGRALMMRKEPVAKIRLDAYMKRQSFVWSVQDQAAEQCGAQILNPLDYMCDNTYCYGSWKGHALYIDSDHVGRYGIKLLTPLFSELF